MSVGQRGRAAAPASFGLVIGLRFVLALRFVGLGLVLLYICDLDRFLQFWKEANEKGCGGEGCLHIGLRRSSTLGASGSRGGHPPSPQLKDGTQAPCSPGQGLSDWEGQDGEASGGGELLCTYFVVIMSLN